MKWWEHLEQYGNEIKALLDGSTDQVRSKALDMHDGWTPEGSYSQGTVIQHQGNLYKCLIAHDAQPTWTPDVSPSLWARIMYREGIRIIPEIITATEAFARDEVGWWGDALYRSLIDGNVYTPEQYPAGWEAVVR